MTTFHFDDYRPKADAVIVKVASHQPRAAHHIGVRENFPNVGDTTDAASRPINTMTLKRTGFKRPEKPAKAPKAMPKMYRQGVTGPVTLTALPKTEAKRNPHLLAMAKGKPCLMRVPGVCNNDETTTVSAHSNSHEHGKSMGRKADDCFSVWACASCHHWYDQGQGAQNREEGDSAWRKAFVKQTNEWTLIYCYSADTKEKAAAHWALDQLLRDCEKK